MKASLGRPSVLQRYVIVVVVLHSVISRATRRAGLVNRSFVGFAHFVILSQTGPVVQNYFRRRSEVSTGLVVASPRPALAGSEASCGSR